jgi:hypothetical protein
LAEKQNQPFPFVFNASLNIDFQGPRVTSAGNTDAASRSGLRIAPDLLSSSSRHYARKIPPAPSEMASLVAYLFLPLRLDSSYFPVQK